MDLFSHFAIILPVIDIKAAIRFYCDQLGFQLNFEWKDPVEYAVLKRGEQVNIHLSQIENQSPHEGGTSSIYIFVNDVDRLYEEFFAKGIQITSPIQNREYGMRDFDIEDLDGHQLTFGKPLL